MPSADWGEAGADRYLSWLGSAIAATAMDVPALVSSAQIAAERYQIDGEQIGIFGDRGLVSEAYGRSGGMMRMRDLTRLTAPGWSGICLGFPREDKLADDFARARALVQDGHHLILFGRPAIGAAAAAAGVRPHAFVTCHASAQGGLFEAAGGDWLVPTSPAAAIVALWAWLGEFVGACTRHGQMPVMYQSYDVPGGIERWERLRGLKFHAQPPVPIAPGWIANRYLAELGAVVERFRSAERQRVHQAAAAAIEAKGQGHRLYAFAHNHTLLRGRLGGPFDPKTFRQINRDWFRLKRFQPVGRGDLVFCVGYSRIYTDPRFRGFVPAMRARGVRLIWSLASYSRDPDQGIAAIRSDEIMIDQQWHLGDAVVTCPGHDVPILPTSGVMAEAVLWSVVSDILAGPMPA